MKKLIVSALFVCGSFTLFADDHGAFEAAMKTAGKAMGPMGKAVNGGSLTDAVAPAKQMIEVYDVTEKFWKEKNVDDAIQMSVDGKAAAKALLASAEAGKVEEAKAAFGKLGATCKSCHAAHREKLPEGGYKIK